MARFVISAFADEAGRTLEEQIAALKENGIDYIEPRKINRIGILDFSEQELIEIKRKLDENGIKVNSLGSPIGKYDITADFLPHLELTRKAIRVCEIFDTKFMRVFSFFTEQDKLSESRDEVLRRLGVMIEEAAAHGITLCHENESRIYGQMPKEVADLLTALPSLGGVFDSANYVINGADVIEGVNASLINLKYLHVKDAICSTQEMVPAGEGEGKIGEILDIINEKTDDVVFLTLEPHLHIFDAYKDIDQHELKGKYVFNTSREAFDFAVKSLKDVLTSRGYERNGNNEWIK